ncbi:MAG: amidase [Thermodesulfobacteriota bacterium]
MSVPGKISAAESGAFVQLLKLEPTGSGPLDGLRFGVKDLIDIGGYVTACGNPDWARTHSPAAVNAVCVDQLLAAGATGIGKTISDELAFSLDGENFFYGTPLNPRAPDRVPGGSSSGSASAVACGLADFALGTDTGGSVRVPASNCGLFGLRPSHGLISVAGVLPFAPTFDTVGILAGSVTNLTRGAALLLSCRIPTSTQLGTIHVLQEALDLCDLEVRQALAEPFWILRELFKDMVKETSIREIDGEPREAGLTTWFETFCTLQWAEIWSSLGSWIEAVQPAFGPRTKNNFELARNLDRRKIGPANRRREGYCRRLNDFLGPYDLLCLPTTPALAPEKGTLGDDARGPQSQVAYYPRTLSLTAIAGIGRLPQVTLPLGNAGGVPLGLSLLAGHGRDAFLLAVATQVAAAAA